MRLCQTTRFYRVCPHVLAGAPTVRFRFAEDTGDDHGEALCQACADTLCVELDRMKDGIEIPQSAADAFMVLSNHDVARYRERAFGRSEDARDWPVH